MRDVSRISGVSSHDYSAASSNAILASVRGIAMLMRRGLQSSQLKVQCHLFQ